MPDANDRIYDWDENKRAQNLRRHGLDFNDVAEFDWDDAARWRSDRGNEISFIATGRFAGKLHTVVYTERQEIVRVISFRRANKKEEERYAR